jgi:hypothetical protein
VSRLLWWSSPATSVHTSTSRKVLAGSTRISFKTSPRLSEAVAGVTREHVLIRGQLDGLLTLVTAPVGIEDVDRVRGLGTALLGRLVRHRQRGSDLVFEAYEFDIGGES